MFFPPALRPTALVAPRAFDRGLERYFAHAFDSARRSLDFEQDDKSWTLRIDVPGITRDDLSIGIEGSVVRIQTRAEAARQFNATYELPADIDAAASEARLEHGVLSLKLGKREPASKLVPLTIS